MEGLSCDGLSATCFIQPTQSGCPIQRKYKNFTHNFSFFFSHKQREAPIIDNSSGCPEAIIFYSRCKTLLTKPKFFFLLPKMQQSIVSKQMPNHGKRWQSQPPRVNPKENKLSIDANHHQSAASLQCGITQCMQFIFNRCPSIIQLNGIARHPT